MVFFFKDEMNCRLEVLVASGVVFANTWWDLIQIYPHTLTGFLGTQASSFELGFEIVREWA